MVYPEKGLTIEEYMAYLISREVRKGEITGVGTLSPVPLMGALLAIHTHAAGGKLIALGDERAALVDGSKELFDLAQRGKLGLFFLSGAQIDVRGNINLTCIGKYDAPEVRLPGGAGSAMLYYMSKRTVLFAMSHSRKIFTERVDFRTSVSDDNYPWRRGRLTKAITPLCVFNYNPDKSHLEVESIHPGVGKEELIVNTGFDINLDRSGVSPLPDPDAIKILREDVLPRVGMIYSKFTEKLKGKILSL